jgi:carboxyl-terminal processing protease
MTPRFKLSVVFVSTLLTLMLVVGSLIGRGQESDGAYRPLAVYTEVLAKIKSDYVEEPNMDKVTNGALQGLVEFLDPQSSYLTAEQFEKVTEHLDYPDRGTGLSTGLVVRKRNGYATVLHVVPGSAADRAGIRPFDLIEAIDGLSTQLMPPAYLLAMLSGPPESSVAVLVRSLRRSEEPEEYTLVRGPVEAPVVEQKMLESDIGYVALDAVASESVNQLAGAVKRLESQGATKLVLDLRGNAAGETEEGVRLADLFLDSGLIASLKGQQYPANEFHAGPESKITSLPLVVITDRATAGAAELAAAAILDNKRGEVVGERTYGLAAVQKTITMDDGAALILSVAKYQRPTGEALQDGGLTPSFPLSPATIRRHRMSQYIGSGGVLPAPPEAPGAAESDQEDPYLKKALEVLAGDEAAEKKAA